MTQDCSITPSVANENDKRFPKGIRIKSADATSEPVKQQVSNAENRAGGDQQPWGYLFVHNRQVEAFKKEMDAYNLAHPEAPHACFIQYSYKYKQKSNGKGVIKKHLPTVSGLVFLQGDTQSLQTFLRTHYPSYHLIKDCSTGLPASISHQKMQPFMQVLSSHPEHITFLRDPFLKFAKDRVKLRVLTGIFKGFEGYIVRVDRDRQLVIEVGGYAVALRDVHNEDFTPAE